jgi:hypothetical protein
MRGRRRRVNGVGGPRRPLAAGRRRWSRVDAGTAAAGRGRRDVDLPQVAGAGGLLPRDDGGGGESTGGRRLA